MFRDSCSVEPQIISGDRLGANYIWPILTSSHFYAFLLGWIRPWSIKIPIQKCFISRLRWLSVIWLPWPFMQILAILACLLKRRLFFEGITELTLQMNCTLNILFYYIQQFFVQRLVHWWSVVCCVYRVSLNGFFMEHHLALKGCLSIECRTET